MDENGADIITLHDPEMPASSDAAIDEDDPDIITPLDPDIPGGDGIAVCCCCRCRLYDSCTCCLNG
jgi:hypothetical protein